MNKFAEYKNLNLTETAKTIAEFWKNNDTFKNPWKSAKDNRNFFYEGPPSANGMPGIHHVMARAIKDIFCSTRPKTENRFSVKQVGIHTDFL
jgi:isoleucyl-tRNA synthetase